MKRPEHIPTFSKALLAGVLTGLAATVVNIVYDIIFRAITRYLPAEEFNFFSITFASMITLTIIGLMFFLFLRYVSTRAYSIAVIVIVIAVIILTGFTHSSGESMFYGNSGLIAGFAVLSGVLALTLLPYLYNHPKIFV